MCPTVSPFPFRSESTDATQLLVVPKTMPPGNLSLRTALSLAGHASFTVLTFGSKTAVSTHLLVVFRAHAAIAGFLIAPFREAIFYVVRFSIVVVHGRALFNGS